MWCYEKIKISKFCDSAKFEKVKIFTFYKTTLSSFAQNQIQWNFLSEYFCWAMAWIWNSVIHTCTLPHRATNLRKITYFFFSSKNVSALEKLLVVSVQVNKMHVVKQAEISIVFFKIVVYEKFLIVYLFRENIFSI